jgi:hypothetical protein
MRDLVSAFYMWISSFPAPFVEEAVFSPLYVFGTFVENQMKVPVLLTYNFLGYCSIHLGFLFS